MTTPARSLTRRHLDAWPRAFAALTMTLTATVMLLLLSLGTAHAQTPVDEDPPGRVARLSDVIGQVWFYSPDNGDWIAAVRNQPVTNGDRIATDAGSRAELQLGSSTLRLDASTELEVVVLDDTQLVTRLHEGTAALRVRDAAESGQVVVNTDDGRFVLDRAGSYRVDRSDSRSLVTVLAGQARYEGPNSALAVQAGQRGEFWIDSGGVAQYTLGGPVNDAFAAWNNERDRVVAGAVTQRYVSPGMTGAEDLDRYGAWEQTPDYGPIWVPASVPVGWAPYSNGHWAWVQPWGWTWVDAAPWGFAPFHYGRWVYARERWCWTPGQRAPRPVYAPALVAWVGGPRANVSISIGGGRGGPPVGWIPLAPREVYVPSHHASPRYVREVNITNVTNVTVINNVIANPQGPRDFGNRRFPHAVTVVPAGVLTGRQPVGPAAAQSRQQPWVRELASQPGRPIAMLAPPVEGPATQARRADPRDVRSPPGFSPRVESRPAGRPEFSGRERDMGRDGRDGRDQGRDIGRESTRDPGRAAMPAAGLPMQSPNPVLQSPGLMRQGAVTAPAPTSPNPAMPRQPGPVVQQPQDGQRGNPRGFDDRRGDRNDGGRQGFRPDGAPPPPRGDAAARETRIAPAAPAAAPAQISPANPPPAAAQNAPVREAPTMRAMPVQRNDEQRSFPHQMQAPQTMTPGEPARQQQQQQQQQQQPRFERPATVAPAPAPRMPEAPRVMEQPRPAPQQAQPAQQPAPREMRRPEPVERQNPADPKRGDSR